MELITTLGLLALASAAGIGFGIITGLTPGVHINLVSAMLLTFAPLIALHAPLLLVCMLIVTMAVTHTFLDTIPSIFLGAPEDDKALGVLPGHRYLLRGNGLMAVKLCVIGGIAGALLAAALFAPAVLVIAWLSRIAKEWLFWVLLAIIGFTVLKDRKPMLALAVFMLSGTLGLAALRLPVREPLLPLLSGMFGVATLLYSINENQSMPLQRDERYTQLDIAKSLQGTALGFLAGMLTALLPGISASAAASVSSQGSELGDHGFLVLLGSLGSASFMLSLAAYIAIEKARNGAMAVVVTLSAITPATATAMVGAMLLAAGLAALLALRMGRSAASWLPRLPYRTTCIAVIALVVAIVLWRSGAVGALVLVTSTAVGLLPAALKTARSQAMGCLLLPVLTYLY